MDSELRKSLLWASIFLVLQSILIYVALTRHEEVSSFPKPSRMKPLQEAPSNAPYPPYGSFLEPNCANRYSRNGTAYSQFAETYQEWLRTRPEESSKDSTLRGCLIRQTGLRYFYSSTRILAASRLNVLWSADSMGKPESMVSGPDETLYAAFRKNDAFPVQHCLCRFNREGKKMWCVDVLQGETLKLAGVQTDGTVYAISEARILAYQPDGTLNFTSIPGSDLTSLAIGPDGSLYVADWEGVHAVDAHGMMRWHLRGVPGILGPDNSEPILGPVVANDGTIYFAGQSLFAISPEGQITWRFTPQTERSISGKPTIFSNTLLLTEDGTILATTKDGQLYAVTKEGKLKWSYYNPQYTSASDAVVDRKGVAGVVFSNRKEEETFYFQVGSPLMKRAWPTYMHDAGGSGLVDYEVTQ